MHTLYEEALHTSDAVVVADRNIYYVGHDYSYLSHPITFAVLP
jgi:hypothetical protein